MRTIIRVLIVAALTFGSGCAKTDWIDRTLVTVDVTGSWYGRTTPVGGGFLIGDFFLELDQRGSTVKGTLRLRGTGAANVAEPIEGTVAGDVFRFRNPRGSVEAELTVSGDEMTGVTSTPAGRRAISLQRVEPSSRPGSQPR